MERSVEPTELIAYDLGLSIASVSKSLQSGMAKLGLPCEAQMVALAISIQLERIEGWRVLVRERIARRSPFAPQ
jgi:hypothetical protein